MDASRAAGHSNFDLISYSIGIVAQCSCGWRSHPCSTGESATGSWDVHVTICEVAAGVVPERTRTVPEPLVIQLQGHVDLVELERVQGYLGEAVGAHLGSPITIDLADVTHISPEGFGLLLAALTAARRAGRVVGVRHPSPKVAKAFGLPQPD